MKISALVAADTPPPFVNETEIQIGVLGMEA
jgi:hypothetical protein